MRHLVIKLDDIGRDSSKRVIDVVLWAMQKRYPISIGTIGVYLPALPPDLIDLVRIASKVGCLEIWNHGFRHIRYDQVSQEVAIADLLDGHKAILDTFGIKPAGFGFPFNRYTETIIEAARIQYPDYFIYEVDFKSFKLVSPEYNTFANGQPSASCFFGRIGHGDAWQNIILQAHPPRWTNTGFEEFTRCVSNLVETRGYVCVSGKDAIDSTSTTIPDSSHPSAVLQVVQGVNMLSEKWDVASDEYLTRLSNFKSYFLARFNSDTQKNWHQVRSELYPYRPQTILDIGCGLGNWSLPFWLAGECKSLILNDVNPEIVKALNDGILSFPRSQGVSVESGDLLTIEPRSEHRVEFIVSANTFNYLDPVKFFNFAQSSVLPGGRMLLMVQTPAFNRLRYRLAFESKDRSIGAEVLGSDFSMLLRRCYGVFTDGTRHAFSTVDINRLANMFDFTLLSQFAPYGESKEDDENVYECLLFMKTCNMREAISNRTEWLNECKSSIETTFGSKAFELANIPSTVPTNYFNYYGQWVFGPELPDSERHAIQVIKTSIDSIRQGGQADLLNLKRIACSSLSISDFAEKVRGFAIQCS